MLVTFINTCVKTHVMKCKAEVIRIKITDVNTSYNFTCGKTVENLREPVEKQLLTNENHLQMHTCKQLLHGSYFFCSGDLWETEGV